MNRTHSRRRGDFCLLQRLEQRILLAAGTELPDWMPASSSDEVAVAADVNPSAAAAAGSLLSPQLEWSTYVSRGFGVVVRGIAVDSSGSAWVTGVTCNMPGWDSSFCDAFVAKIAPGGTAMEWFTPLGGSEFDAGEGIVIDGSGNAWIVGDTESPGWVTGGIGTAFGGGMDVFVAKIDRSGTVVSSGYVGGGGFDFGTAIALDGGNVWVAGRAGYPGWSSGSLASTHSGGDDAFVAKINSAGWLEYTRFLGGAGSEEGTGIAVDSSGGVWVTGDTDSAGWAGGGFNDNHGGGYDGFVAKLDAGGGLAWASYLGGSADDSANGIDLSPTGDAWITGETQSEGWANGGFDISYNGGKDAFVAKVSASGALDWSSYLGGSADDLGRGITVDSTGGAWVVGDSASADWAYGGFDTSQNGGTDALLAKISASGTLTWTSFLGGEEDDFGAGVAIDGNGKALVAGATQSPGWVSGGFGAIYTGYDSGFVAQVTRSSGVDNAPTDISLTALTAEEAKPVGTIVATFWATDPDVGDEFRYDLVSGPGSDDNGSFTIAGNELKAAAIFNRSVKSTYTILARVTDAGGLSFDKAFTLTIVAASVVITGDPGYEWMARDAAYDDWAPGDRFNGYTVAAVFEDAASGFDAFGLTSATNGPLLLLGGTQPSQLTDLLADANVAGVGFGQFTVGRAQVEAWVDSLGAARVDMIGHSLGGALAQWFAADWTSKGHAIGEVVTFNSPGISKTWANQFSSGLAERVMHYVVNGDVVSLAGDAFIAGSYTLASFRDLNLLHKHQLPILVDSADGKNKPSGLSLAGARSTSKLNDPLFMYHDRDYLAWLAVAEAGILAAAPTYWTVPPKLLFRCTTEQLRKDAGGALAAVAQYLPDGRQEIDLSLPDIQGSLLGLLQFRAQGLHLHYQASPQSLTIQGRLSLPGVYNATADFAGDNKIVIDEDGWKVIGTLSVSNVVIAPGQWEIKSAAVSFNTVDVPHVVTATGVIVAYGKEVTATIGFLDGKLDLIELGVDGLNVYLGYGVYLQKLAGEVHNLAPANPNPISFGGEVVLTFGPHVDISLPSWLGGGFSASLFELDLTGTMDINHIEGAGTLTFMGGLGECTGHAELNWVTRTFYASVDYTTWGGVLDAHASLTANGNMDLFIAGTGNLKVPGCIPLIGGRTLGTAGTRIEFTNNGRTNDDYIAAWTRVRFWFIKVDIGFRVWMDGRWEALGAKSIKALRQANSTNAVMAAGPDAAMQVAAAPALQERYELEADQPYALVTVKCDQNAGGADIRLIGPDGRTYTAADILAGDKVALVEDLCTDTQKTVVVNAPEAGLWTVEVADPSALGNATIECYGGIPVPALTVTELTSTDGGRTVALAYTVADAAAGAKIGLYCDDDGAGWDGVLIRQLPARSKGKYLWKTDGMPAGNYRFYAVLTVPGQAPVTCEYTTTGVQVPSSEGFGLVDGKQLRLTRQDSDGDLVTYSLTGGGRGELGLDGQVTLTGTTNRSVLKINVKKGPGGDGMVWLSGITADGPVKSIVAAQSLLRGEVRVNANDAAVGAKDSLSLSLGQLVDVGISSIGLPIGSLKLLDWRDTDQEADALNAPAIGAIKVAGRAASGSVPALAGDLQADISTGTIKSITLAGSLQGAVRAAGIGAITAKAGILDSTIVAAGGIKTLTTSLLSGSAILVGVPSTFADRFADAGEDFTLGSAVLGSLSVTGVKRPPAGTSVIYVTSSYISAPTIGAINLTNVAQTSEPIIHVHNDTGTLKLKQTQDAGASALAGGTWKPGVRPTIWEVV